MASLKTTLKETELEMKKLTNFLYEEKVKFIEGFFNCKMPRKLKFRFSTTNSSFGKSFSLSFLFLEKELITISATKHNVQDINILFNINGKSEYGFNSIELANLYSEALLVSKNILEFLKKITDNQFIFFLNQFENLHSDKQDLLNELNNKYCIIKEKIIESKSKNIQRIFEPICKNEQNNIYEYFVDSISDKIERYITITRNKNLITFHNTRIEVSNKKRLSLKFNGHGVSKKDFKDIYLKQIISCKGKTIRTFDELFSLGIPKPEKEKFGFFSIDIFELEKALKCDLNAINF